MFSEKLKQLREKKGLTQEELAEQLSVSRSAVAKWEQGRGIPAKESFNQIAQFFGVAPTELFPTEEAVSQIDQDNKRHHHAKIIWVSIVSLLSVAVIVIPFVYGIRGIQQQQEEAEKEKIHEDTFFSDETLKSFGLGELSKITDDGKTTPFLQGNIYYFHDDLSAFESAAQTLYSTLASSPLVAYLSTPVYMAQTANLQRWFQLTRYLMPIENYHEALQEDSPDGRYYEFSFVDHSVAANRDAGSAVPVKRIALSYTVADRSYTQTSISGTEIKSYAYNCEMVLADATSATSTNESYYLASEYFDCSRISLTNENFADYFTPEVVLNGANSYCLLNTANPFAYSTLSLRLDVDYYRRSENPKVKRTVSQDYSYVGSEHYLNGFRFNFGPTLPSDAYEADGVLVDGVITGYYRLTITSDSWFYQCRNKASV